MQSAMIIAQLVVIDQIRQLRARLSAKGYATRLLIRTAAPSLSPASQSKSARIREGRRFETEPQHGRLPALPTKVLRRIVNVVFSVD
jgi:hypothetical protein